MNVIKRARGARSSSLAVFMVGGREAGAAGGRRSQKINNFPRNGDGAKASLRSEMT